MLPHSAQTPRAAHYTRVLAPGWRIIVLDTTDLSLHAGHAPDSPEGIEAAAYLKVGVHALGMYCYHHGCGLGQRFTPLSCECIAGTPHE